MTEVVVQHLANQTSIRIYCNDLVRKVAVYYNRLAVGFVFYYEDIWNVIILSRNVGFQFDR